MLGNIELVELDLMLFTSSVMRSIVLWLRRLPVGIWVRYMHRGYMVMESRGWVGWPPNLFQQETS